MNPMLEFHQARMPAPFAVLGIRTIGERLTDIEYLPLGAATLKPLTPFTKEVCRQLAAYLTDPEFEFDLPCEFEGTDYQRKVWQTVRTIPPGSVLSYLQVARRIGSAPRPVGSACGANRIPILIPCHRVIASNGIGGFMHTRRGSPIEIKRWLLHHENPGAY
ncbi:MAG: methylated-DNA--[protein]-cysteine S-methyltransferase [Betaproteobacteria bacterium]